MLLAFLTSWMGENGFPALAVGLYGVNLLMCGVAYSVQVRVLVRYHPKDSKLALAIGSDRKGNVSVVGYAVAILASYWMPWVAILIYVSVAVVWLVPDRRIEKVIS